MSVTPQQIGVAAKITRDLGTLETITEGMENQNEEAIGHGIRIMHESKNDKVSEIPLSARSLYLTTLRVCSQSMC